MEEFKQTIWWVTMFSCGFQVCPVLPEILLDLKVELDIQQENSTFSQPVTNKEIMTSPIIQLDSHTLYPTCIEDQDTTFRHQKYNCARDHPVPMLHK
jgi:hypothetical protein